MRQRLAVGFEQIDALIEPALRAARIPGAAIAVATGEGTLYARGYGYRDLQSKLPVTADTIYPIASTTKALNATLLGMLVDQKMLSWDAPVQQYVPGFQLMNAAVSADVTLRDLLMMRTGLSRHDWLWLENPMTRAELVDGLRHLELAAGFREKFQYCNMSVTTAGYAAELVAGQSWERLVQTMLFEPLGMSRTACVSSECGDVTLSYHENSQRQLAISPRFASEVTAPSGGAVHSTVNDMARWVSFNLRGGSVGGRQLVEPRTLTEIHSPQIVARPDPSAISPHAAYAMGWFTDTYKGHARVTHGGYLHDVHSDVMLFPEDDLGIVTFTNFGFPALSKLINEQVFELLAGMKPAEVFGPRAALYEERIISTRERNAAVRRVPGTAPSHALADYAGTYSHPGYGRVAIRHHDGRLIFHRNRLIVPLVHWHYDAWVAEDIGIFPPHVPHAFDRTNRMIFETNPDGEIDILRLSLEPAVAPIQFRRHSKPPGD